LNNRNQKDNNKKRKEKKTYGRILVTASGSFEHPNGPVRVEFSQTQCGPYVEKCFENLEITLHHSGAFFNRSSKCEL